MKGGGGFHLEENFKFVISNTYSHLNTNRYCTRLPLPALPLNVNNVILVSVTHHTSTRCLLHLSCVEALKTIILNDLVREISTPAH